MRCCGAAPPTPAAWDRSPPWGRPLGQHRGAGGGSPPRRPGPVPPAAPPHSSASEPGWTPASTGGPSGGAGRGTGPPGRGGDGGGAPRCHVCWVRRAPRHGPSAAPTLPRAMRVAAGAQPGDAVGSGSGAHCCTEPPVLSCPPDVRGRATRVALCCAMPCRAVPRRAPGGPCSAPAAAAALAGGEGAPAGEEALPPPGLGPSGLGRPGHRRAGGRHRPALPLGKASLGQARGD